MLLMIFGTKYRDGNFKIVVYLKEFSNFVLKSIKLEK
jgi:hypothetical protein